MKILVTGATGFIGKNLVDALLEKKHEVFCIVRKTSKVARLEEKKIPLAVADLLDSNEIERVFSKIRPEVVFHCAAAVMEKDEDQLHNVNVMGTRNVCQTSYRNQVKRLVYLSSIAVINGIREFRLRMILRIKRAVHMAGPRLLLKRLLWISGAKGFM